MRSFFIFITFFYLNIYAQWEAVIRLTYDTANSSLSFCNARCIAASGDSLHVVWFDNRNGNNEIYYKRSVNNGISWPVTDTRLTNDTANSGYPSVAVSGGVVHVVWHDYKDWNYDIFYKCSINGGESWVPEIRLTNSSGASVNPSMAISGSSLHVVWYDYRDGNYEIYYKRSSDGGITWQPDTRLTNNPSYSYYPSISVSGQDVHVVWYDHRDGNEEIYYKRSTNAGLSWGEDKRLTSDPGYSWMPCVSASVSLVHVIWMDTRAGNVELFDKRSVDAGLTWLADARLTNTSYLSEAPSISVSGSFVHCVWQERYGNGIYYKRSLDGGLNWENDVQISFNPVYFYNPSIAVRGTNVHVIWQDKPDANYEIYYKKNPTGNLVGLKNLPSEIPSSFKLYRNYPNPFNPITKIRFDIPSLVRRGAGVVVLRIYDILGREVTTLINEQLQPGTYEVEWDGSDYSSGIYYYRLSAGDPFYEPSGSKNRGSFRSGQDYTEAKKMILIK